MSPNSSAPAVALDEEQQKETGHVGMVVFLASWAMLFGAMFFAYSLVRVRQPVWPPAGVAPLSLFTPTLNTLIILASSLTLWLSTRSWERGERPTARRFMYLTNVLAAAFFVLQCFYWVHMWNLGLTLQNSLYGALFYTLTVFHAVHVVAGLGLLAWSVPALALEEPSLPIRIRASALFWHFVDGAWLIIFVTLYLF
jgi:heme/copper-type cytochrome/quinol oxidase subunit 3